MSHVLRLRPLLLAAATAGLAACAAAAIQEVPTPEQWLGRPVGADFHLADWAEVSGFYAKLAESSPRVRLERVGESTEGRDYFLAVVSSEENLGRLDELKSLAALLADPRGKSERDIQSALERGRPFVMLSLAMHSTEVAAPQFGMELAWRLATSDEEPYRSARERLVVLILPCTNPDGLDRVVSWYRSTVGTPHEAAGMTELYQLYAGHDNNRDWFMLSLAETRIVSRLLYREWHPQVYWDVHQQGQRSERLFVPPFRDPLNPNLDPGLIAGIGALGTRALLDMTREGLSGVATGVRFDMWWNGGNRNVPVRHNLIGLLTEAASAELASPVFLRPDELRGPGGAGAYAPSNGFPDPWPGGWWRLRDIIDYEHGFARSLLKSLAAEPRTWLELRLEATRRSIAAGQSDSPRAWVVPSTGQDVGAVRRLAEALLGTGVELCVARGAFVADEREFPAGSIVLRMDQPYGPYVKDLFEVQRYPGDLPPYDVAGWTLPLLLGVERVEVVRPFEADVAPAVNADEALAGFVQPSEKGVWPLSQSDSWRAVFGELRDGRAVTLANGTFLSGERDVPEARLLRKLPRVGLYAPWSGNMSEGWLRWVCEYGGLPFVTVRNEALRAGRLSEMCDVLVLPDVSRSTLDQGRAAGTVPEELASGLDPEGAIAVEEFVRAGGTLVAIEGSAAWAIDLFDLPLSDAARGQEAGEFSCPGSVLRAIPAPSYFTRGLPASLALFFEGSSAWKPAPAKESAAKAERPEPEVLLRYDQTRLLLSGWIREGERIEGLAAWVRANYGNGAVHLFGFSPHYRSWTQQTFPLLWRAILLDGAS